MTDSTATTILVVEDDPAVRNVMVRGLQREGYRVLAETGERSVEFSRMPRIDVLVSDVGLPAETGYDIARRCQEAWPHCEVILVSGHAPEDLQKRGVSPDIEIVQKPVQPRALADRVYKLLTQRAWRALRADYS